MTEARTRTTWTAWARRTGTVAMRGAWARRAALRLARARGRALVLVYHRVAPDGPASHEVVRSLPSALFERQLRTLRQIGDIVPLFHLPAALAKGNSNGNGPCFAITFDDDHPGHRQHALAVLDAVGAHATFFLSGRGIHGLGPYWWSLIEESVRVRGIESTSRALGLTGATPSDLAIALQGSTLIDELPGRLGVDGSYGSQQPPMPTEDIAALTGAGMTVGFHTLHHPVLTTLSAAALESALTEGREALAAAAGAPVDLLAYPHGLANADVAAAAERAGFRAAYATGGRPIRAESDSFLLGRWDPGDLEGEAFAAALALRLLRPAAPARDRRSTSC